VVFLVHTVEGALKFRVPEKSRFDGIKILRNYYFLINMIQDCEVKSLFAGMKPLTRKGRESMRSKWIAMAVVAVCAVLLLASVAMAQKLLCVSEPEMKGQKNIAACSAAGDTFAYMDKHGLVRVLSKEELELSLAFNPKIGQLPAFSVKYGGQAGRIPPMPVVGDQPSPGK
jgi:hypothetical protein